MKLAFKVSYTRRERLGTDRPKSMEMIVDMARGDEHTHSDLAAVFETYLRAQGFVVAEDTYAKAWERAKGSK